MRPIKLWYLLVGFLLLAPLFSCGSQTPHKTNSQFSQYSGDDESGIGGTGILANQSGIGGTGIIGEITGFGSIFVNGIEVEVDSETHLYVDGKKVIQHQFARGEVVALRTAKNTKQPTAREIHVRHEVIGKVEKVLPQTKSFVVLGQRVNAHSSSLPAVGTFVRVSGFRDSTDTIHARHISISDSHNYEKNMLRGQLKKKNNKWYVGQQEVSLPLTSKVQAGEIVRIQGALSNKVLQVKSLQRLTGLPFSKPVKNILIQGFIQKEAMQQYTISGYGFNISVLAKQLSQKTKAIVLLKRTGSGQSWQFKQILNRQQLPMGSPLPNIPYNRAQQPLRPMVPQQPYSMPNRFFR